VNYVDVSHILVLCC